MEPNLEINFNSKWTVSNPRFSSDLLRPELCVSPWAGHRNFAYDLVSILRPQRIVELGTHYGCSFFAFLQASKDLGLETEHVAVDTWIGEDHAGLYGEDVFHFVNNTIHSYFNSQNIRILRKTFNDALEDILDNSVDVLHIDGFHSYEAVRHDYQTWLPKLMSNGVVLFHDIAPSSGYGSSVFWSEIKNKNPHFEFLEHSFGLGILFPKGSDKYSTLSQYLNTNTLDLYRFKSEFSLKSIQYSDAQKQLEERWVVMQSMEALIRDRDDAIVSMETLIRERDAIIINQQQLLEKVPSTTKSMRALFVVVGGFLRRLVGKVLEKHRKVP